MAHKDRQIQQAKELQASIQTICQQKEEVCAALKDLERQEETLISSSRQLQAHADRISAEVQEKAHRLQQIKQAMLQKEAEYMTFLEAQPALVHVLRNGR
mmetsp:Transcript_535/g.1802  ORF Transcript_535/g.1802 Transcript_535/m.1802 type:complete len:100 (-) Transcript_535:59-358(-)